MIAQTRPYQSGFSIVELLVCIALITVVTSLGIPLLHGASEAQDAKDKRNAQSLCSLSVIAQASGVGLIDADMSKVEALEALRQGVVVPDGPMRGRIFRINNLPDGDLSAAARYVQLLDGQLFYNVNGVGGP